MGKLGDQWGRTRLIYVGLAMMVITALLAPLSRSLIVFVLWRVIQAVATSMIYPNAIALVRQYRANDLGKFLSRISIAGGIATSKNGSDWYGSILFAAAITIWLFWLNAKHPSISSSLLELIVSLVLTISLILVEFRQSAPVIPIQWFHRPQFTFSTLVTIISNLIMYCVLYGIPVYLQNVCHFNASQSGLFLLIFTIIMTLSSPIGGRFAQGTRRRMPMVISGLLVFAGAVLLWLGTLHSLVLLGIGLGAIGFSSSISNIVTQQIFLESVPQK